MSAIALACLSPVSLAYGNACHEEHVKLECLSFPRVVNPLLGPRRALVMLVSHQSLHPSGIDEEFMRDRMEGVREIFSVASRGQFELESVIVPEPVLLPGDYSDYDEMALLDLYAVINAQVVATYGSEMDPARFEVLVYFFPNDSNPAPFGMTWLSTFGLRYVPAVANISSGLETRPEAIAHEIGHGFLYYGHAAAADPATGEVTRWAGDPYDLMGYGLNQNLINPPHMGMIYRHYWGWTSPDEITPVIAPGIFQLDPDRALLVQTSANNLLWLEIISSEQAYFGETGGVVVRIDRASQNGIYSAALDVTPATEFKADMHLTPGHSLTFEGRRITYLEAIQNAASDTPSARVEIEAVGDWPLADFEADVTEGLAPLTVQFDASASGPAGAQEMDYSWSFFDLGSVGEGPVVSHTFMQPGDYPVRLTVTNQSGARSSAVVMIKVEPSRHLFPFYRHSADSFTGLAVSNYSQDPAELRFRLFDTVGTVTAQPDPIELAAGKQLAQLGYQVLKLPPDEPSGGWIELQTENPHLGTFFQFGTGIRLDGSVDAIRSSGVLHFTRVFQGSEAWNGQKASTWLSVVNPTSESVTVNLTLRVPAPDETGQTLELGSVEREIAAFGLLYASVDEIFGDVDVSNGIVTAAASGAGSLSGFELLQLDSPATSIGLSGVSMDGSARVLFSAQLASSDVLYTSLRLFNLSDEQRRVFLTPIAEDGSRLSGSIVMDLPGKGILQRDVGELFGFDPDQLAVGSLRVDTTGEGIVGDVVFGSPGGEYAAAMPLQTTPARKAVFSQVANIPGSFFTGLALHNPQLTDAAVEVRVFNAEGVAAGAVNLNLPSGARLSKLLTELVPSSDGVIGGYVIVESTEPLVLQQFFGDSQQTVLSAVPPTLVE